MNKKAQFDIARKAIYWTIAIVVMSMVIIGFSLIVASYKNRLTAVPPEIRAELIALRFLNIPDCFAYQDPDTQQVFPGMIDMKNFNAAQLYSCYKTADEKGYKDFNFRFLLKSGAASEIHTNKYYNVDDFVIRRKVLVKNEDMISEDELVIYVQETI